MLLAFAFAAAPPPRTSTLSWVRLDGAESCVAAPALAREVEATLGRPVFVAPGTADLAVEGRVERLPAGGWRASLRLLEADGASLGDRTVDSPEAACTELGHMVALTVALLIDPEGPPAPVPPAPPPEPVAAPEPPPAPRWSFEVDAAALGGAGLVPGVGVGGLGAVVVRPPGPVAFVAQGEIEPFARWVDGDAHVDLTRLAGGLLACPLDVVGELGSVRACVGVDAGAIFAVGSSEALVTGERVLVDAHGAVQAGVRLVGPLFGTVGVQPVVSLRRVAFAFVSAPDVDVYRTAGFALYGDVGLGVTF